MMTSHPAQHGATPVFYLKHNPCKTPEMMKAVGYATNELHHLFYDFKLREKKPLVLEDLHTALSALAPEDVEQKLREKDEREVRSHCRHEQNITDDITVPCTV